MAMIVTVANDKGGVGKTTIVTVLAEIALAVCGKVAVIDTDGSQNAADNLTEDGKPVWDGIDVFPSPRRTPRVPQGYGVVLVDTPPTQESAVVREAVRLADVVVVPSLLCSHAFRGAGRMYDLAPERVLFVVTQIRGNARLSALDRAYLEHARADFAPFEIPYSERLRKNLANRDPWHAGMTEGQMAPWSKLWEHVSRKAGETGWVQ